MSSEESSVQNQLFVESERRDGERERDVVVVVVVVVEQTWTNK
jgi:hypothetical protein